MQLRILEPAVHAHAVLAVRSGYFERSAGLMYLMRRTSFPISL